MDHVPAQPLQQSNGSHSNGSISGSHFPLLGAFMRILRIALLPLVVAALTASPANSQYAATQDSTLRGLERVYVNFATSDKGLSASDLSWALEFVTLELRKAGLRLVRDQNELDPFKDAILNVSFIKVSRAMSTDVTLRLDIEQRATLTRTGQSLRMMTWFYEDDRRNVDAAATVRPIFVQGVNRFLNSWLAANGR